MVWCRSHLLLKYSKLCSIHSFAYFIDTALSYRSRPLSRQNMNHCWRNHWCVSIAMLRWKTSLFWKTISRKSGTNLNDAEEQGQRKKRRPCKAKRKAAQIHDIVVYNSTTPKSTLQTHCPKFNNLATWLMLCCTRTLTCTTYSPCELIRSDSILNSRQNYTLGGEVKDRTFVTA